jgi:hypothetical protein
MMLFFVRAISIVAVLLTVGGFIRPTFADECDSRTLRILVNVRSNIDQKTTTVYDEKFTVDLNRPHTFVSTEDRQAEIRGKNLNFVANINIISPTVEYFPGEKRRYVYLSLSAGTGFGDKNNLSWQHPELAIEYGTDRQLVSISQILLQQPGDPADNYTVHFYVGLR